MHSPIAATARREPIHRRPIQPKAAARFPEAFRALLRFPTRTVRKLPEVVASATIEASLTTNELRRHRRAKRSKRFRRRVLLGARPQPPIKGLIRADRIVLSLR